jgi:HEAT repeat protein
MPSVEPEARNRSSPWGSLPAWGVVDALASGDAVGVDSSAAPPAEGVLLFLGGILSNAAPDAFCELLGRLSDPDVDDVFRHRLTLAAQILGEVRVEALRRDFAREVDAVTGAFWGAYWPLASTDAAEAVSHMEVALRELARAEGRVDGQLLADRCSRAIDGADEAVRRRALDTIALIGVAAAGPAVFDALLAALADHSFEVQCAATRALGAMGRAAAIPRVLDALWETGRGLGNERLETEKALGAIEEDDWGMDLGDDAPDTGAATPETIRTLLSQLAHEDRHLRRRAASALRDIGLSAAGPSVLGALCARLSDDDWLVRKVAVKALAGMGEIAATPAVLDALCAALVDPYSPVRRSAAWVLGRMGRAARTPSVIAALDAACHDKHAWESALSALRWVRAGGDDWSAREADALRALEVDVSTCGVLDTLRAGIAHDHPPVRVAAANALLRLGKRAATPDVLDALRAASADSDADVSSAAAYALSRMGPPARPPSAPDVRRVGVADGGTGIGEGTAATTSTAASLTRRPDDNDAGRRPVATSQPGRKRGIETFPGLVERWNRRDDQYAWLVPLMMRGLVEHDANAEALGFLLAEAANPDPPATFMAADKALEGLTLPSSPPVLEVLASRLSGGSHFERRYVVQALGRMGPSAVTPEILAALGATLADQETDLRRDAAATLGRMGPVAATPFTLDALTAAAAAREKDVRSAAIYALGEMGRFPATPVLLDALAAALADEDAHVRWVAVNTLEKMSPATPTPGLVTALCGTLADQELHIRHPAAEVLRDLSHQHATAEVVCAFVARLRDWDSRMRQTAIEVLDRMDVSDVPPAVVTALVAALRALDGHARSCAARTLARIGGGASETVVTGLVSRLLQILHRRQLMRRLRGLRWGPLRPAERDPQTLGIAETLRGLQVRGVRIYRRRGGIRATVPGSHRRGVLNVTPENE